MLDRRRIQFVTDALQNGLACLAVVAENPYLDQFVGGEVARNFTGDRIGQSAVSDVYRGFEGVGAGFERTTFSRSKLQRHKNLLIRSTF